MNGIHDMGGMHGFGPIPQETGDSVFHEPWQGRMFGIALTLGQQGIYDPNGMRFDLESMEPAEYLGSSYYQRWLLVTERVLVAKGVLTQEELDAKMDSFRKQPQATPPRQEDTQSRDRMLRLVYDRKSLHRETGVVPRFRIGDAVIVRNVHSRGHSRLPRYVRGKRGVIFRLHGIHDIRDSDLEDSDTKAQPQPLYNVRFEGRELWGESAETHETLHIDMWESYLEPKLF